MNNSLLVSQEGRYPRSYWAASARHHREYPTLEHDHEADVAIIGAGFTGLSAAYHLSKLGRSCVILEAHDVGWGASGRNGGMAVPRYKLTFPELERRYGTVTALRMYRLAHEAVDTVETIVRDCSLSCGFSRYGHITPIRGAADLARFEQDVAWLALHAEDRVPRMLNADEVAERLGTQFYRGGYFEPRGAGIHPLEYCQSLAHWLTTTAKVKLFGHTPAMSWSEAKTDVIVHSPRSRVKAQQLILATNAYSDLTTAGAMLRRRVVPVVSALIATSPLDFARRSALLPKGNLATDAQRLTKYYRMMPDGRFLLGGRGGASSTASLRAYRTLERDMARMFPELRGIAIDYRWYGLVAVTLDNVPHIGQLTPRVFYGLGYNGRGVALAALMGSKLARLAMGEPVDLGPMSNGPFRSIPFHSLRVPAKQIAISFMRLRDAIGR